MLPNNNHLKKKYDPNEGKTQLFHQDNTKLKMEVVNHFEQGNFYFNNGATVQDKEKGLNFFYQGLKTLNYWIQVEKDQATKEILIIRYKERSEEVEEKKKKLDQIKSGKPIVIKQGGGGEGGGKGDDENDKMENQLSDAIVTEKPNVKWTDIAGLEGAKAALHEAITLPIKFPQMFQGGVRKPWKGILLYGPPGTGKSYLAKACATEVDCTFFSISSSDLISKFVGESEKLIKKLFGMAREKKPCIIFIDEIDSLCGSRSDGENEASRRVKTEFLVQMNGVGHDDEGVLVLGATNLPQALDPAIRRRFEKRIYIPLPTIDALEYMLKNKLHKQENTLKDSDYKQVAPKLDGYSGSDIAIIVKDAVYAPVKKFSQAKKFKEVNIDGKKMYTPVESHEQGLEMSPMDIKSDELYLPPVCFQDLEMAINKNKPSVNKDQLRDYEKFTEEFGMDG